MPPLLDRSEIGVHQRRKLFEMRNQYTLADEAGVEIGRVEQVRQSPFTFLARLVSDLDVALPVTLEVQDSGGATVLELRKPWLRMRVEVRDADGQTLGFVGKKLRVGKAVYALTGPSGEALGEVRAQDWRSRDFRVADDTGREVAKVTKQWRGLLTEAFTDADSYAVLIDPGLQGPLRSLAFSATLAIDLVQKQKDSG
jgi:uncharacterized protein YxjI